MGNKQESVSQGKSKHNLPPGALLALCSGKFPCAWLYLMHRHGLLGRAGSPESPGAGAAGSPSILVAKRSQDPRPQRLQMETELGPPANPLLVPPGRPVFPLGSVQCHFIFYLNFNFFYTAVSY